MKKDEIHRDNLPVLPPEFAHTQEAISLYDSEHFLITLENSTLLYAEADEINKGYFPRH
jgi:hypothetical protein